MALPAVVVVPCYVPHPPAPKITAQALPGTVRNGCRRPGSCRGQLCQRSTALRASSGCTKPAIPVLIMETKSGPDGRSQCTSLCGRCASSSIRKPPPTAAGDHQRRCRLPICSYLYATRRPCTEMCIPYASAGWYQRAALIPRVPAITANSRRRPSPGQAVLRPGTRSHTHAG